MGASERQLSSQAAYHHNSIAKYGGAAMNNRQNGFTLIETLIAMAIFTIGILGLFGMQAAAIKNNFVANRITIGSTWAMNQVEQLLGLDYTDPKMNVTGTCSSLSDWSSLAADNKKADPSGSGIPPIYTVYWSVARDCTLTDIKDAPEKNEQKPKHLRITVTVDKIGGSEQEVAIFNYIKQNAKDSE
ncbi:prepilin-type N-terminal cleavage/methylation domain-containing protein [Desulfobulbus sp. F5]|nr:prepilin-type N-terminal cleavage/methylation domain-containing protein [Desulfobulbus sp. F5]